MFYYFMARYYNWITTDDGRHLLEHRYIMEQQLGRKLTTNEIVHHKNSNGKDNRPENLELTTKEIHSKNHKIGPKIIVQCYYCEKELIVLPGIYKKKLRDKKEFYCSKSCVSKHRFEKGELDKWVNASPTRISIIMVNGKDIDVVIKEELQKGLKGYSIAKKYNLNRKTVYNHINKLKGQ